MRCDSRDNRQVLLPSGVLDFRGNQILPPAEILRPFAWIQLIRRHPVRIRQHLVAVNPHERVVINPKFEPAGKRVSRQLKKAEGMVAGRMQPDGRHSVRTTWWNRDQ